MSGEGYWLHTFALLANSALQDDETLRCLKSEDAPTGLKGWLRMLYNRLYVHDIDAVIGRSETVMRIHGNCENFYMPAEFCFARLQVCLFACRVASSTG